MTTKISIGYPQADAVSLSEQINAAGFTFPVRLIITNKTVQPVMLPSVRVDIPSSLAKKPFAEAVFRDEGSLVRASTDLEQLATIRLSTEREGVAFEITEPEKPEAKPAEKQRPAKSAE